MTEYKSPYYFVPLSKHVVFPEWADRVSHDLPFKDGLSGEIDLTVTTASEAYIRNGGCWDETDRKNVHSEMQGFFEAEINGKKQYMIPGTSLKGVLCNVLEIASFSKLNKNKFADHRYSIRDLYYDQYTKKMTDKTNGVIYSKVKAGWLRQGVDADEKKIWEIIPCEYARVDQSLLKNGLGRKSESAVDKYKRFGSLEVSFTLDPQTEHSHSCGKMHYKKVVRLTGDMKGTLVLTGQPAPRQPNKKTGKMTGKHMEFIFFNKDETDIKDVTHLKKDFEFIHSDDTGNPNEEWREWKKKIDREPVPVFYLDDNKGNIESFGLAMMYRMPYPHKISDAINHTSPDHSSKKADLPDLIFGSIDIKSELKGRVQISHFTETDASARKEKRLELKKTVLGGPKPTFYPNYIKQSGEKVNKHNTFMDDGVKISGWKRYPAEPREPSYPDLPTDRHGKVNEEVATLFKPLPMGTEFSGKVRFHNLKPVELGALLWTITWGGNNTCQHQIGMAKPLGLGRISVDITGMNPSHGDQLQPPDHYIEQFKQYMETKVPNWENSEQIKELVAMADIACQTSLPLTYPVLSTTPRKNEFADFKRKKLALPKYSAHVKQVKVKVLSREEKKLQQEKEAEKAAALSGSQGLILKKLLQMNKAQFRDYIVSDAPMEEKAVMVEAYHSLLKGQREIVEKSLKKGRGDIFDVLKQIEAHAGKQFA